MKPTRTVAQSGTTLQPAQAATAPVRAALITVSRLQVGLKNINKWVGMRIT